MSKARQALGKWGESMAAEYLTAKGYEILGRNLRTPYGEIDLIARLAGKSSSDRDILAFVEVKARATPTFGYPEEAVNLRKRLHLLASAQHYMQAHPELDGDWRIDVIAIQRLLPGNPPAITHFENAVSP
jgi:putative endonuclease